MQSDPIDKLSGKDISEVTVDSVKAVEVTPPEVALIQEMPTGQRENPMWLDARQGREAASNFGGIVNSGRDPGFYPLNVWEIMEAHFNTFAVRGLAYGNLGI